MLAPRLSVGVIDDFFGVKRFHPQKLSSIEEYRYSFCSFLSCFHCMYTTFFI